MHIELDGHEEYEAALSPENQLKLGGLAATIVGSCLTPFPVQAISTIGHADTALLVPVGERPKKEMAVNVARAKVAESQLPAVWVGELESPETIALLRPESGENPCAWRVLVQEWERLPTDPAEGQNPKDAWKGRMIYADSFEL